MSPFDVPAGLSADYGFDPLQLGNKDLFVWSATEKARPDAVVMRDYRDAEIRHGRLAMLAALAWPVQELASPSLARFFNVQFGASGLSDVLTETSGRAPSVLNGGLEQGVLPLFLLSVAVVIGALDLKSLELREAQGEDFAPGDYAFDPLRVLQGAAPEEVFAMQASEVNHGRLAMLAVTGYAAAEALLQEPIVHATPQFFAPLYANPAVLAALDHAYGAASAAQRISGDQVASFFHAL